MTNCDMPDDFLRGIANAEFICEGNVLFNAFQFEPADRSDDMMEASINWYDSEDAIEILLNQQKSNGKKQFVGVAQLKRSKISLSINSLKMQLSYERKEIIGNPFHGNLLVSKELQKPLRTQIMNCLALVAGTNIIYNDK